MFSVTEPVKGVVKIGGVGSQPWPLGLGFYFLLVLLIGAWGCAAHHLLVSLDVE